MKFTVLIPVYLKENPDFLNLSLRSITDEQTLLPDEILVVEDGPITKKLCEVLDYYENKYQSIFRRIRLDQNVGMGRAMNFGLQNASNKWIARMDSDDLARSYRFKIQTEYLENHNEIDVLGSSIEEFNISKGDLGLFRGLPLHHDEIIKMMKFRNPINHMTVFYKRDFAIRAGGYWDRRYFEDYNLWYEMSKQGAKFANLGEPLVDVRIGNNMISRRSGINYFRDERFLLKKLLKDKFISELTYSALISAKLVLRIVPSGLLRIFYKNFLRKT